MKKERDSKMRLIVNESLDVKSANTEPVEDKAYQSNPVKSDLYSKLLAYKQSQKKFNVKDLIKDSLK